MKEKQYIGPINPFHPRLMKSIPTDIEGIVNGFKRDLFEDPEANMPNDQNAPKIKPKF